jgi:transposase
MASIRVAISNATRKDLQTLLSLAYRCGDVRLVRRVTAVLSLAQNGDVYLTTELVNVARSSVYAWLRRVLENGVESLKLRKSPGRPPRLTKTQKQQLVAALQAGPEVAGFVTVCWTALLVQQWIEREFGVLYNRHYVCELLHNLGFSYQKAAFVSDHLNPDTRKQWLEATWPEILRVAHAKQAWILFGDEVSFAQWGSLGYTWARKGQQPVVKTSGKRKGYKVFGVIEFFSGRFFSQTLTERFNSESYQAFLSYVLAQTDGTVILIQDGARYHTSRSTRDFFAAHADRLIVYQLPSYSPDYNPIEFLWKQTKQRATHNRYFPQFDKLMAAVDEALAYFAKQATTIKNLMGGYLQSLDLIPAAPGV